MTNRGHCEPGIADALDGEPLEVLQTVFGILDGDEEALAAKRGTPLQPDFLVGKIEQLVELDESQHFTSARLRSLEHYPTWAGDRFGLDTYRALCASWCDRSDRDFAHRQAAEFPGPHGRQRQRAYFDAFRDLAAARCGHGTVIRIPAPERDAQAALELLLAQRPTD